MPLSAFGAGEDNHSQKPVRRSLVSAATADTRLLLHLRQIKKAPTQRMAVALSGAESWGCTLGRATQDFYYGKIVHALYNIYW